MHPTIISIGPLVIRSYGFMLAIGILSGIMLAAWRARKKGENPDHIYNLSIWVVISSLLGARIHYIITHYHEFRADEGLSPGMRFFTEFKNMFWPVGSDGQVGISGLILYGGLILGTITVAVYLKHHNLNILKYMDLCAPSLGLGEFFTRIGCFLNGCCFGSPADSVFGVVFPGNCAAGYYFPDTPIHPAQLYNSFAGLSIFVALIALERYKKFDGYTALLYFILYSVGRFIIDFFRYYEKNMIMWGLSQNQILSLVIFIGAVGFLVYFSVRARRHSARILPT